MIYSLDGTLTYFDQNFAVVSCGGVGFKCFTTLTTLQSLPGVGKPVQLFTYLSVREDALDLYGFATTAELDCFKLLISVNGVGPKVRWQSCRSCRRIDWPFALPAGTPSP